MPLRLTHSTGIPREDMANPTYLEAEERGIIWLRRTYGYGAVVDTRERHVFYDSLVMLDGNGQKKLDYKCDLYVGSTGRAAWEDRIRKLDKTTAQGWGVKGLDYVLYIAPQDWHGWLVDGAKLSELGKELRAEKPLPEDVVAWSKLNPGKYAAEGLAIPIARLRERGAVLQEMDL